MSIHTHKLVNGEVIPLTQEEILELEAIDATHIADEIVPPTPTKEQLLAELQALTAKIQSLE